MKYSITALAGLGISFLADFNLILQAIVLIISLIVAVIGLYQRIKK